MTTKPRIAEYGQVRKEDMAVDTPIKTVTVRTDYGKLIEWKLSHRSVGYTQAGSCLRYQNREVWRSIHFDRATNSTFGQAFLTLTEAEEWLTRKNHCNPAP